MFVSSALTSLSCVSFILAKPQFSHKCKICWSTKYTTRRQPGVGKLISLFSDKPVKGPFPGRFGNWYLTERDLNEVWCYRASLGFSSLCLGTCLVLSNFFPETPHRVLDLSVWLSSLSLGIALQYIHIYMKVLKQVLQVFWFVGVMGMLFVQFSSESHELVMETVKHPASLLFSGWTLIALSGLFFKEAFCYRHYEAVALTLLVPFISVGHVLSFLPGDMATELSFLTSLLYIYFSLRKFGSPVISDLGDKSIFEYLDKQNP